MFLRLCHVVPCQSQPCSLSSFYSCEACIPSPVTKQCDQIVTLDTVTGLLTYPALNVKACKIMSQISLIVSQLICRV